MSYKKLDLKNGDTLTAAHLAHMESGIEKANETASNGGVDLYKQAKMLISRFHHQYMVNVAKETDKVDIAIFAGQSNSCGRATVDDVKTDKDIFLNVPIESGFTFQKDSAGNCDNTVKEIIEPISANGASGTYGYIPTFINAYHEVTGRKVCACFKSNGGTSMHNWFPYELDSNGRETTTIPTYYAVMKKTVNSSKSYLEELGYTVGDVFIVWCQGENDAAYLGSATSSAYCTEYGTTLKTDEQKIAYYKAGFSRIVEKLKEDVNLSTAFIIRIGHKGNAVLRNEVIIQAQNELCRENPDCVMVSSVFAGAKYFIEEDGTMRDLMRSDHSHYLPEGYVRAGMEAGVNAGIYQNSNKLIKPILLEYNTLYKIATNNESNVKYERDVDKYLYDPCRVDFSFMRKFENK